MQVLKIPTLADEKQFHYQSIKLGDIEFGGIRINITHNQDTAVPFPYN